MYLIFNYPSPKTYEVIGVDVSSYQGEIDWNILSKQGINFILSLSWIP